MATITDWYNEVEQHVPSKSPDGGYFDTWHYSRDYSSIFVNYSDDRTLKIDGKTSEHTWS